LTRFEYGESFDGGMNRKLREAVRGLPGDAGAWFAIGQAAAEAGNAEEARYALLHSVDLVPADLQRAIDAGQLLGQVGCLAEAERLFRQVLHQVPELAALRTELARVLLEAGRTQDACVEAERALGGIAASEGAGDPDALLLAADANLRAGNRVRAVDLLRLVLACAPDHVDANRRLARIYTELGEVRNSIACWRREVRRDPRDLDAVTSLGIALSEDGQHSEAVACLQAVARERAASAPAHANLGMALIAAESLEDALLAFERARSLDPSSAAAHCGLGLAHQRLCRWPEAAAAFAATERLAPDNSAAPFNLAIVLQALEDLAGARAAMGRAAALAPEDPEIRQALERLVERTAKPASGARKDSSPYIDASIAGDLKSFQLFDVLELLRMQSKSGSLVLSSRQGAGIVRLCRGEITSASAPGVPHLGRVLIAAGLITAEALQAALAQQRASPAEAEVIGAVLLRGQLITEAQLTEVLFEQVQGALAVISGWGEGAFSFHRDQHGPVPPVGFAVPQVVLEVVRRRDERQERDKRAQAYLERSGGA
jgi:Flp pilus assembly protein TadD